ncbi:unnamed protein product [Caenorhabditis brenneri]
MPNYLLCTSSIHPTPTSEHHQNGTATGQIHPPCSGYEGHFGKRLELPHDFLNYDYSLPGSMKFDKVLQRTKFVQIERDRWLKHQKLQQIRYQRPSWE